MASYFGRTTVTHHRQQAPPGAISPALDVIIEELKELARAKSVGDYRATSCPALRRQLGVGTTERTSGDGQDKLRLGIERALSSIPDEQYRDGGIAILGFTAHRWSPLRDRQSDAARAFGLGFDAFRRRRSADRPSLYEECIHELARAVVADRSELRTPAPPPPISDGDQASRARLLISAAGAGLLGLVIGLAIGSLLGGPEEVRADPGGELDVDRYCSSTTGTGGRAWLTENTAFGWRCTTAEGSEQPVDFGQACSGQYGFGARAQLVDFTDPYSWSCGLDGDPEQTARNGCRFEAGFYSSDDDRALGAYARGFSSAYEQAGGIGEIGCPVTPMYRRGPGVAQDLGRDGRVWGAMLALVPEHDVVVLTADAWDAYHRIGGGTGLSVMLMGYPTAPPTIIDSAWQIPGSNGGALVAADVDGPYFLVPQLSMAGWQQVGGPEGDLGLPVSDFYGTADGIRQDFQRGHVLLGSDGLTVEIP